MFTFSGQIPSTIDKLLFSDDLDLSDLQSSLNEISVALSEESFYPNDTTSDEEYQSVDDERDKVDEETGHSDEEAEKHSDNSLYRLYHPHCSNSEIDRYFKNLKQ